MNFASIRTSLHRRLGAMLLAALLGASAVVPARAADGRLRGRGPVARQAPFAARALRADRPAAARAQPAREQAAQAQTAPPPAAPVERPSEAPQVDRGAKPGRLTPEERRALRQQINDAGRDIYHAPRP